MYYVYIIKSKSRDWRYIGYTANLKRRIKEHQNGLSVATKPYAPFKLMFYEAFEKKEDAMRREKYFKTTKGKRALKFMMPDK